MFHSYFTSVSPCVNKCPCRTHGHSDCRCALGRFVAHGGFTDEGALTPRYSQANMWEFSVSVCAAGEANCEPCGLGFSLLGWNGTETTCQPCKSGTYKPISSATCVPCYPGTFGTAVGYAGSYECRPCRAGTYNPSYGSSSCLPCQPNYTCPLRSSQPYQFDINTSWYTSVFEQNVHTELFGLFDSPFLVGVLIFPCSLVCLILYLTAGGGGIVLTLLVIAYIMLTKTPLWTLDYFYRNKHSRLFPFCTRPVHIFESVL
jgi:hypothetical protein